MRRIGLMIASAAFGATLGGAVHAQQGEAPRVLVAAARMAPFSPAASFVAQGEAIDRVEIVARIAGFVEEIAVADGAAVAEGDLMFRIERDRYAAIVDAREAELAAAEAQRDLADLDLGRKEELFQRGSVPEAERDLAIANQKAAAASVRMAEAALRQAEVDLGYTEIHAPFDGRVGRVSASPGEAVGPSSPPLVSLARTAPIDVRFSVSEKAYLDIVERIGPDPAAVSGADAPVVTLTLPNGSALEETGTIAFVENRIDQATGAMTVRARFDNAKGLILDGAFMRVSIGAGTPQEALFIPQAALQRDQRGDFVLVVGEAGMVEQRHLTLGARTGADVVVEDGLREGEAVIVEGLQRVRIGTPVETVTASDGG